jgi:hypothetical protein
MTMPVDHSRSPSSRRITIPAPPQQTEADHDGDGERDHADDPAIAEANAKRPYASSWSPSPAGNAADRIAARRNARGKPCRALAPVSVHPGDDTAMTADPAAVAIAELRHALRTLLAIVRLADIDAAGCDIEQYDAAISAAGAALAKAESFTTHYRPI